MSAAQVRKVEVEGFGEDLFKVGIERRV